MSGRTHEFFCMVNNYTIEQRRDASVLGKYAIFKNRALPQNIVAVPLAWFTDSIYQRWTLTIEPTHRAVGVSRVVVIIKDLDLV